MFVGLYKGFSVLFLLLFMVRMRAGLGIKTGFMPAFSFFLYAGFWSSCIDFLFSGSGACLVFFCICGFITRVPEGASGFSDIKCFCTGLSSSVDTCLRVLVVGLLWAWQAPWVSRGLRFHRVQGQGACGLEIWCRACVCLVLEFHRGFLTFPA